MVTLRALARMSRCSATATSQPPTLIEELNTVARWTRGFTRAGMAGPTNAQHPDNQHPKVTSAISCKQQQYNKPKYHPRRNTWSHSLLAMYLPQNVPLGVFTPCIKQLLGMGSPDVTNAISHLQSHMWQKCFCPLVTGKRSEKQSVSH